MRDIKLNQNIHLLYSLGLLFMHAIPTIISTLMVSPVLIINDRYKTKPKDSSIKMINKINRFYKYQQISLNSK